MLWSASELLSGKNDSSKTDTLSVRNQFADSGVIKRWVMPLTVCGEGATSKDHSEMIVVPVIANIRSRKDQATVEAFGFGRNFPNWYAQLLNKKNAVLRSGFFLIHPHVFPGVKAVLHYTWNPDLKGSDNPVLSGFGPSAASVFMVLRLPVFGGWLDA